MLNVQVGGTFGYAGNILGGAVYVITGVVVRESGPAGVLAMVIAGLAALLISFSYAELASRLPRAGGAYTYTYVIVGELIAFLVGWSVILVSSTCPCPGFR